MSHLTLRVISLVGIFAFVGIAWLLSRHRRQTPWNIVLWGVALQLTFGLFVLKTPIGRITFSWLNDVTVRLLDFTKEGSRFIFGDYLDDKFTLALHVLPTIIFFSSLMTVFYHLGVMQRVVEALAYVMRRTLGTSGAETLSAAANVFIGQTEAPLMIKPYLERMTRSELNAVMVAGFSTVAGGVLAAYVGMLKDHFPDIAGHLIAASVMSAPAALVIAKVMLPELADSETAKGARLGTERVDRNILDAAARGASEGLTLALNVAAMLLAFLALLALLNYMLGWPVEAYNHLTSSDLEPWTLEEMLGTVMWPLAFLMGVDPQDCSQVAQLLGEKIVLTEFVSYVHLSEMLENGESLAPRSVTIASYALCGFANFGSIGIQLGGIGAIVPSRRTDLADLAFRAMIGGALATCMTGAVAGLLL